MSSLELTDYDADLVNIIKNLVYEVTGEYLSYAYILDTRPRKPSGGITHSISYLNNEQQRRYVCKTGRYVKKLEKQMVDGFTDRQVEVIAASINDAIFSNDTTTIEQVSGTAIQDAYEDAVGGESCMTYDYAVKYLEIYANNPNVSLLIARTKKGGYTRTGRALLWKYYDSIEDAKNREGPTKLYGDNIYMEIPECKYALKQWMNDNCDNNYHVDSGYDTEMYVPFDDIPEYWPYCDTFRYASPVSRILSSYRHKGSYMLEDTEGCLCGWGGMDDITCYRCRDVIDNSDMRYHTHTGSMYCTSCWDEVEKEYRQAQAESLAEQQKNEAKVAEAGLKCPPYTTWSTYHNSTWSEGI